VAATSNPMDIVNNLNKNLSRIKRKKTLKRTVARQKEIEEKALLLIKKFMAKKMIKIRTNRELEK